MILLPPPFFHRHTNSIMDYNTLYYHIPQLPVPAKMKYFAVGHSDALDQPMPIISIQHNRPSFIAATPNHSCLLQNWHPPWLAISAFNATFNNNIVTVIILPMYLSTWSLRTWHTTGNTARHKNVSNISKSYCRQLNADDSSCLNTLGVWFWFLTLQVSKNTIIQNIYC